MQEMKRATIMQKRKVWHICHKLKKYHVCQNERSNKILKCKKMSQLVLLITGIAMISYGAIRGEAATVLGKAIKLCLECVGIG